MGKFPIPPTLKGNPFEPQITYYSEETVFLPLSGNLMLQKREPVSLTLALIWGTGLAWAGTRITALTLQDKNYNSLKADTDKDIHSTSREIHLPFRK